MHRRFLWFLSEASVLSGLAKAGDSALRLYDDFKVSWPRLLERFVSLEAATFGPFGEACV